MKNIFKKITLFICFLFIFILVGCNSKTNTNAVASTNSGTYLATTPEKTLEVITPTPTETQYIDVESTTTAFSVEPTPTAKIMTKSETTPKKILEVITPNPTETPYIDVESTITVSSVEPTPTAKKVEGILVGGDEYYNFYFSNGKIHSIRWNGTEEDNDTFLYNDYFYFESEKGIYRFKTHGANIELLIENGTGHFSGSFMTITKVEKGAIFYIRHGLTGSIEYRLKIANDSSWAEPKSFGQIDSANKFCFNDEGKIRLIHVIDDNLITIRPLTEHPTDAGVPIFYEGYLYFTYLTNMYRVTSKGTGFERILDAKVSITIKKIENDVIYYDEILEYGRDIVKKQMKIK